MFKSFNEITCIYFILNFKDWMVALFKNFPYLWKLTFGRISVFFPFCPLSPMAIITRKPVIKRNDTAKIVQTLQEITIAIVF